MYIKRKKTKIKNFRSFIGNQETPELPDKGFFLIDGLNKESSGSSGSGKSSLLMAMTYPLDYCPYPATELQNWDSTEKLQVSDFFELDGKEVIINRGAKTSIIINSEEYEGANLVASKIKEIFKLSPDMFRALTYRQQGQGSFFLSMDDSEKKSFLSEILGLTHIEDTVEQVSAKVNDLIKKLEVMEKDMSVREQILASLPVLSLGNPDLSALQQAVEFAKANIEVNKSKIDSYSVLVKEAEQKIKNDMADPGLWSKLKELDDKLYSLQETIAGSKEEVQLIHLKSNLASAEETLEEFDENPDYEIQELERAVDREQGFWASSCGEKRDYYRNLKYRIDEVQSNINATTPESCFNCGQEWGGAKDQYAKLQVELQHLQSKMSDPTYYDDIIKEAEEMLAKAELELNKVKEKRTKIRNELVAKVMTIKNQIVNYQKDLASIVEKNRLEQQLIQAEIDAEKKRLENIKADLEAKYDLNGLKAQYTRFLMQDGPILSMQLENAMREYKAAKQQAEKELAAYERNTQERKEKIKGIEKLSYDIIALKKEIDLNLDLIKMLGREGFLGTIFDQILEEISQEVSDMLKQVPNVSRITFGFSSEKVTKKGTSKRSITPVIYRSGMEIPLRSGLSGGMRAVVELAVDLAVSKIIKNRSGIQPNWLFLDEAMDGLGEVEKTACLELLKIHAQDCLVLCVDHDNLFKPHFDGCIKVEFENEVSYVQPEIYPVS